MKKSLTFILCLCLILILSLSIISAFSFSDFWRKITGKASSEISEIGMINVGQSNIINGLNITLIKTFLRNNNYGASIMIPGNSIDLTLNDPVSILLNEQAYTFELISATSTSATIKVTTTQTFVCGNMEIPCSDIQPCCSGLSCINNLCKDPSSYSCKLSGESCTTSSDCCSGLACCVIGNTCNANCPTCKSSGQTCTANSDCCSGLTCQSRTCKTPIVTPCTDSDGGIDIYLKGHTIGFEPQAASGYQNVDVWDVCVKDSSDTINSIREEFKNNIYEYGCKDGYFYSEMHTCPNGCRDGICQINLDISIATLKDSYNIGEQIKLTDPPDKVNINENILDNNNLIKSNGYIISFDDEPILDKEKN